MHFCLLLLSSNYPAQLTSSAVPLLVPVVTITPSLPTPSPDSSSCTSQRASDSPSEQTSPLRNLSRQGTAAVVTLLPNKMNVSELSGQQQQQQHGERRTRGSIQEDSLSLDSAGLAHVPCSDPDFIRGTKSNVRGTQSCPMGGNRNSICGGEHLEGRVGAAITSKSLKAGKESSASAALRKVSPLLSRRTQLAPPKVKRSSSMTRLTEALNQVHNVCLFPAQPNTLVKVMTLSHSLYR